MDVIEAIARGAAEYPDKIAHISDDRSLTYKELATKSDALAAHLVQRYPGDKSPVAIIGHKGPEMLIGFLGAVKSGHPYVPIDLSVPVHRANRIVESSGAIAALTPDRITEISNGFSPSARVLPGQDDPFYIIYTSGSTGDPKGVIITLRCRNCVPAPEPFSERCCLEHLRPDGSYGGMHFATDNTRSIGEIYAATGWKADERSNNRYHERGWPTCSEW